jgi:hypothetical protein
MKRLSHRGKDKSKAFDGTINSKSLELVHALLELLNKQSTPSIRPPSFIFSFSLGPRSFKGPLISTPPPKTPPSPSFFLPSFSFFRICLLGYPMLVTV